MAAKKTHAEYIKELASVTKTIVAVDKYVGSRDKLKHRCTVCGYTWECLPGNLVRGLTSCHQCLGKPRTDAKGYAKELRGRKIELVGSYSGRRVKARHRCMHCTYAWDALPDNVIRKGSGCPACSHESRNRSFKGRTVRLNGRKYRLQGFEPQAIEYLRKRGANLKKLALDVKDGKPTVKYRDGKKTRLYIPDFYYRPKNRIIEVKSAWTFAGHYDGKDHLVKNRRKARACIEQGYDFCLIVLDREGNRIRLPKNWHELPSARIRSLLSDVQ